MIGRTAATDVAIPVRSAFDGMGVADMFRLTRKPSRRRSITAPLDLEEAIQIDDLAHGRDRRGWTLAERRRASLYARCVNNDLEPTRVAFACWLVNRGGMSDE
jgi:hypothetical protein